ncbi:MAG: sensor histidine kinase [Proteobacteria bacterium]|nr:sensor histidine kinase [Pseudomonadota bacterium]
MATNDIPTDQLREANHRIANHLTLLVGMVQTQARGVALGPETLSRDAARAMLQETAGKIVSISHLHRRLAQQSSSAMLDLGDYLIEVGATLVSSLALDGRVNLTQSLLATGPLTPEQAQQLGLLVSEIIMNAVKHAHPTGIPVQISLGCRREPDGRLAVEIADDGVGLPEDFDHASQSGVGFRLIRSLAQGLRADLRIESDSLGLSFLIVLPHSTEPMPLAAR